MNGKKMAKPPTLIGIVPSCVGIRLAAHLRGNVFQKTKSFGPIQNLQQHVFRLVDGEFVSVPIPACWRVCDPDILSTTFLRPLLRVISSWCLAAGVILQEKERPEAKQ